MKDLYRSYLRFINGINKISLIPAIFFTSAILNFYAPKYSLSKFGILFGTYILTRAFLHSQVSLQIETNLNYFFNKYRHLTRENLYDLEDNRRKFFRLDTSSYYRESSSEILHDKGHHEHGDHHDASIYYGPHPADSFKNLSRWEEINNKFSEGKSSYDSSVELVLGEPIDIKRIIRTLPTVDDFKKALNKVNG